MRWDAGLRYQGIDTTPSAELRWDQDVMTSVSGALLASLREASYVFARDSTSSPATMARGGVRVRVFGG